MQLALIPSITLVLSAGTKCFDYVTLSFCLLLGSNILSPQTEVLIRDRLQMRVEYLVNYINLLTRIDLSRKPFM